MKSFFWKIRRKLISWLAGEEPVLMNFTVFLEHLPPEHAVVRLLPPSTKITLEEAVEYKTFLLPSRCIIDGEER